MTEQSTTHIFDEAPASWNTRYVTPDGFTCQITLRDEKGVDLLNKAQAAMKLLQEQGCEPYGHKLGLSGNGDGKSQESPKLSDGSPNPAWCSLHNTDMKRREKDGQVWFSHKILDGSWCKGETRS